MRIPFPIEISVSSALLFFGGLLAIQIAEGTDPTFAIFMFVAQIFGILAFNALEGMSNAVGIICLFSLMQNVTVPEIAHAIVLQPGDYILPSPLTTAAVSMAFFACIYIAAKFSMTLPTGVPVFDRLRFTSDELRVLIWAAPIINAMYIAWSLRVQGEIADGSLAAVGHRLSVLLNTLSVILATHMSLRRTNGKVAMNATIALMIVSATLPGILIASKEGMLLPIFSWLLVTAAYGHRFTRAQVLGLAGGLVFFVTIIYPYSQFARFSLRNGISLTDKLNVIQDYAKNPTAYMPKLTVLEKVQPEFGATIFGNNIVARFSVLYINAEVIDFDRTGEFTGIVPHLRVFYDFIPHFLWRNHPVMISGNEIAHKVGFGPGPSDYTTGITIGAPALFYDVSGWPGLLILTIPEYTLLFFVARFLVGKASQSIWCLVLLGLTANEAGSIGPGGVIEVIINLGYLLFFIIVALKVFSWSASAFFPKKANPIPSSAANISV